MAAAAVSGGLSGTSMAAMHSQYLEHREHRIAALRSQLLTREWLFASGLSSKQIAEQVLSQALVRVIPGCFVSRESWQLLFIEDRLLLRTLAVSAQQRSQRQVFCFSAAAAIWGLPLYALRDERVHLLVPDDRRSRSTPQIARHDLHPIDEDDVVEVGGLLVTSLSKTVIDIARCMRPETAIGVADAGLRVMFGAHREAVLPQVFEWQVAQVDSLLRLPGRRGVRKAQEIVTMSDPRADSVVESVSRLQLARLGIEVEIQIQVTGSNGARYWIDFQFVGQGVFGEVDGTIKYVDERMRGGRDMSDVVLREKQREDDIRGVTGERVVRWTPKHIGSPATLGSLLRSYGLDVPRMP